MEIMKIVGCRSVHFTDDSGRPVDGVSFYYEQEADGVEGVMAGKLFVSEKVLENLTFVPSPGEEVEVYYNKYGKVSDMRKAK